MSGPDLLAVLRARRNVILREGRLNETDTRRILVELVLAALGWDTTDTQDIKAEKDALGGRSDRADYALYLQGEPVLVMEAKALGVPLGDKEIAQVVRYGKLSEVRWGVLTDGNIWIIVNTAGRGRSEQRRFRTVAISDAEKEGETAAALRLLSKAAMDAGELDTLWEAERVEEQVKGALEAVIAPDSAVLLAAVTKALPDLGEEQVRECLARLTVELSFSSAPPSGGSARQAPPPKPRRKRSIVPDPEGALVIYLQGQRHVCKPAYQAMIEVAEWLIGQGKLRAADCPVMAGTRARAKRYLVNTEPRHPDGKKFFAPKTLSGGMVLEVNYSRVDIGRMSERLLEWAGMDAGLLKVGEGKGA